MAGSLLTALDAAWHYSLILLPSICQVMVAVDASTLALRVRCAPLPLAGISENPAYLPRNLTRPKILKTPGVVIEPLRYNKALERSAASVPANNAKRKSVAVVSNGMRKQSKR